MVFIKHNSLKPDISFNPIFIPCFSESRFSRVQVFQGRGPGFSECRFFRVQVQVLEVALLIGLCVAGFFQNKRALLEKRKLSIRNTSREPCLQGKLCFTQYKNFLNISFNASDLFPMFTQSMNFYTFYCRKIKE